MIKEKYWEYTIPTVLKHNFNFNSKFLTVSLLYISTLVMFGSVKKKNRVHSVPVQDKEIADMYMYYEENE